MVATSIDIPFILLMIQTGGAGSHVIMSLVTKLNFGTLMLNASTWSCPRVMSIMEVVA